MLLAGGGGPPLSWGFFPYAAISVLQALQTMGLAKRAQLKVSVVEIYLDPLAGFRPKNAGFMWMIM